MSGPKGDDKRTSRADVTRALELDISVPANSDRGSQGEAQSTSTSTAITVQSESPLKAPTQVTSNSLEATRELVGAATNVSNTANELSASDPRTLPTPQAASNSGDATNSIPTPQNTPSNGSDQGPQSTSTPTPTDDKGTTGESGGGNGSGGGGGSKGPTAHTPDEDPDKGPGKSNNTPIEVKLVEEQFNTLIDAIKGVSTAVESGNKIQAGQLIDLQTEIRALADILKETATKSQITPELVEQLSEATEALTGAVGTLKDAGGKVDSRLARITDELGKLTEGLANFRFDDIIAGIQKISEELTRGAGINKDLLTKILDKIDASSGTTKLDETQLKALTDAIAKLEQGQQAQVNQAGKSADKSNALLGLMLEELKELREQIAKSKPEPQPEPSKTTDPNRIRADYPVIPHEQKQDLLDLLRRYTKLGDPNFNPGQLNVREVLKELGKSQNDPRKKDPPTPWIDSESEYKVKDTANFDKYPSRFDGLTARAELTAYYERMSKEAQKNRREAIDVKKAVQDNIESWGKNDRVRFLHIVTPPVTTAEMFRVRYVTSEGRIETFEASSKDFFKQLDTAHKTGNSTLLTAGLMCGTAILSLSFGVTPIVPLAVWALGSLKLTNNLINLVVEGRSAKSKYNALVFDQTLTLARKGLASPSIFLPVLAHMHFMQQMTEKFPHSTALRLAETDPIGNSPYTMLQNNIFLMEFMVKKWEQFETGCKDFSTGIKSDMTVERQKNIDESLLAAVDKNAAAFERTILRKNSLDTITTLAAAGIMTGGFGALVLGSGLAVVKSVPRLWRKS